MSDADKIVVEPVEVPGMQITFQSPVGPSGKGISFVLSADLLTPIGMLNELVDKIASVTRRQDAFEQLRLDQNSLAANRKLLAKAKAALDAAQRVLDGRLEVVGTTRRRAPDAARAAPGDVNAVAQHQQRVIEIEGQIVGCEERIPFWKAILRGEEPLDVEPERMAAE